MKIIGKKCHREIAMLQIKKKSHKNEFRGLVIQEKNKNSIKQSLIKLTQQSKTGK